MPESHSYFDSFVFSDVRPPWQLNLKLWCLTLNQTIACTTENFESFSSRQLGLLSAQLLADCAPERYLTGGYESSIGFLVSLMHNCLLKQGRGGLADWAQECYLTGGHWQWFTGHLDIWEPQQISVEIKTFRESRNQLCQGAGETSMWTNSFTSLILYKALNISWFLPADDQYGSCYDINVKWQTVSGAKVGSDKERSREESTNCCR